MTTPSAGGSDSPLPDRAAMRAELEATRMAYHALLAQLTDADWSRRDGATRRTIGEDMVHITSLLEGILPLAVDAAREGRANALPPMPKPLGLVMGYLLSKMQARGQTRHTIGVKYDAAHVAALHLLDEVQDNEWTRRTNIPIGNYSIAEIFHLHTVHFHEHATQVRQGLRA